MPPAHPSTLFLGRTLAQARGWETATLSSTPLSSSPSTAPSPPVQVHRATLHTGESVVVKVQRPGLRQLFEIDLEVLGKVAEQLDRGDEATRDFRGIYKVRRSGSPFAACCQAVSHRGCRCLLRCIGGLHGAALLYEQTRGRVQAAPAQRCRPHPGLPAAWPARPARRSAPKRCTAR